MLPSTWHGLPPPWEIKGNSEKASRPTRSARSSAKHHRTPSSSSSSNLPLCHLGSKGVVAALRTKVLRSRGPTARGLGNRPRRSRHSNSCSSHRQPTSHLFITRRTCQPLPLLSPTLAPSPTALCRSTRNVKAPPPLIRLCVLSSMRIILAFSRHWKLFRPSTTSCPCWTGSTSQQGSRPSPPHARPLPYLPCRASAWLCPPPLPLPSWSLQHNSLTTTPCQLSGTIIPCLLPHLLLLLGPHTWPL